MREIERDILIATEGGERVKRDSEGGEVKDGDRYKSRLKERDREGQIEREGGERE